ncbi:MAG TPA: hypothetical protein VK909_04940, partial [Anaerolineales bacterium]|nr:hypothetical protein [Anaerolineales bacterium]
KKSPKKESEPTVAGRAAKPSTDPSFLSPEMQKKRYDAAMEFVKLFQEKIPLVGGKPHEGTVLAVAARLAGSSLYRALNEEKEITPGVIVLSEQVNEAWPQLLNLFAVYCKQSGIDILSKPMITKFPEQNQPLMDVNQILAEYQDQYHEVMKKHGLDYLNGARAGMIVCSVFFQYHYKTVKDIDPFVAAGIVAMGIVEGAKTAPPPLRAKPSTPAHQTTKNNDRLVLGERDAAIQEALDNGGAFIDLNPEVLRTLQAGGIDPYIIYEKALLNKIEEKVGRIDFTKVNVEELYEEWKGKAYGQAPIYVRLIMWLKNNASQYGYEHQGNSWIRT